MKTKTLEEVNTALRALLKKRDEDKALLEQRMLLNVRELVIPYIERMKETPLNELQQGHLDIIESTLKDIVAPFLQKLFLKYTACRLTFFRI